MIEVRAVHALQSCDHCLLYIAHVIGRLKSGDDITFSVDQEFCEVPADVCLITILLVICRSELIESGILESPAESVERLLGSKIGKQRVSGSVPNLRVQNSWISSSEPGA